MVFQVTAVWTGFTGAPGYSTFAFNQVGTTEDTVNESVAAVHALLNCDNGSLASNTHIAVQQEVREFSASTGALVAIHSADAAPAVINGSGGAQGPGPAGLCISWGTVLVNRGRVVRGRTFIVPLAASSFGSDGTLNDTTRTNWSDAAADYWNDADFAPAVWSRPISGAGGASGNIVSSNVRDIAAVLRSRRD